MEEVHRSRLYENALLVPPVGGKIARAEATTQAGAFGSDGKRLPDTALLRRGKEIVWPGAQGEPHRLAGEAIYCGHWAPAFGHFLLESLSRLWFLKQHPAARAVWFTREATITSWQKDLLEMLGVTNEIILVDSPTVVERLIVPAAGFEVGERVTAEQRAALAVVRARRPEPGKRVWLSRSRMDEGLVVGEDGIETRIGRDWIIFHPQEHSVAEQIAMLCDAERIAGFAGSAFHLLVLFDRLRAKIDLFARDGRRNATYEVLADAYGWQQTFHVPDVVRMDGSGNGTNHLLYAAGGVLRVLLSEGAPLERYSPEPDSVAAFLNKVVGQFDVQRYLEIGVAKGVTFFGVDAPYKEAVDPWFRFDYWRAETDQDRFFEMPSDEYFATVDRLGGQKFDLIFIDGLHTFDQTYRDFLNSLEVAHDRTIWLIDDTIPFDVYGAWPEQELAVRLRAAYHPVKQRRGAWQGDVFKVIMAIHDFQPGFSFATIENKGKLHTLVWRERRTGFKPVMPSLEAITRMSFVEFLQKRDLYNFAKSNRVIERIARLRAPRGDA